MAKATVYPKAIKRFLPEAYTQSYMTPTGICLHSDASRDQKNSDGSVKDVDLYGWWTQTGAESHIQVAWSGVAYQYMPFNRVAHANGSGNGFLISFETQSRSTSSLLPWSDAQIDTIVDIILFLNKEWGIRLEFDSNFYSKGITYHSVRIKGNNPVHPTQFLSSKEGGKTYSSAFGKTCPGPKRIQQIFDVILPRLGSESYVESDYVPTVIGRDDAGSYVSDLQDKLNVWINVLGGIPLESDGDFGPKTETAVKTFQSAAGFSEDDIDGLWGPNTNDAYENWLKENQKSVELVVEPETRTPFSPDDKWMTWAMGGAVQRMYKSRLDRPAELAGVQTWAPKLITPEAVKVAEEIGNSPEAVRVEAARKGA